MAHLTQLWNDKLKAVKGLGTPTQPMRKQWTVTWDDPQYGQGEKVHEDSFFEFTEAMDHAISIGLKYDLRKRNGKFHQLDPNLSRIKSGFAEPPEDSAIPAVWPSVHCYGHMPQDVTEEDIVLYCMKNNITNRPQWSLVAKDREAQKALNAPEKRKIAGPLSFDDMISKRTR
jgi:hypothetical protein|tara:strand:+ start:28255 stop:28770 length:516 start_codon:yes stop_codon:yes gene_type:complete